MIDQKAIIESKCPVSGEQIRITVSPNGIDKIEPPESVLSIVIPDVTTQGPKVVEELWMVFCHRVYFFKSEKLARSWLSIQKFEASILSIEDGFELGRLTFTNLIKFV
jgi:alkylmercury lyase